MRIKTKEFRVRYLGRDCDKGRTLRHEFEVLGAIRPTLLKWEAVRKSLFNKSGIETGAEFDIEARVGEVCVHLGDRMFTVGMGGDWYEQNPDRVVIHVGHVKVIGGV